MQMNKGILRNSEIVIFEKKNNFAAVWMDFFQTAELETFFFTSDLSFSFAWIKNLLDKNLLNTRKPRGEIFHAFASIYGII